MVQKPGHILLKLVLACFAMMLSVSAFAQNSFTVKMKLVDAKTDEPVEFATASLTVKGEKSAAKYVLADNEGAAETRRPGETCVPESLLPSGWQLQ